LLAVNHEISDDRVKAGMKEAQEKLNEQKKLLKGCNREINEAHAEKSQLVKDMNNVQLQVQELEHKMSKCNKDTNDAAKLVCETIPCLEFCQFRVSVNCLVCLQCFGVVG